MQGKKQSCQRSIYLARFMLNGGCQERRCEMEEKMKELALREFGTLKGVTITYKVDQATGRVLYCFTRK